MSAGDDMTPRPDADDLLAGLDPELADVARRLVADAQGSVPSAAFAQRLAGELRSSVGTGSALGRSGNARPPAPDDLGRSLAQPPLWAKVAVGILSVTLVYGLIASVFRPKTTPPDEVPVATSTAAASETPLPDAATLSPSPSSSPSATSTPTPTPTTRRSGAAALSLEATPIALPTATRTLVPSAVPTPTDRRRTATATRTPTRRPTSRPSDTPVPTPTTVPSDTPKPSATTKPPPSVLPSVTPHPTRIEPTATATPHEPDASPTPAARPTTTGSNDCVEACTRKSIEWYRECVEGGGGAEDCLRRSQERRAQCIRDECEPTPAAGR